MLEVPYVCIGKVLSSHGVKGEVKVHPYTDFPERCSWLEEVRLGTGSEKEGSLRSLRVEKARIQGKLWLLKFVEVDDRDEADDLRESYLYIKKEERMPLPEGRYYFDQVIGLSAYTTEGVFLGKVKDIIPTGGHDTYVVGEENSEKDYLVPAVKQIITEINLGEARLTVDPPEGLLDL